jgi:hypothetical protein
MRKRTRQPDDRNQGHWVRSIGVQGGSGRQGKLQVNEGEWGEDKAARALSLNETKKTGEHRHTTAGIRWWSPTQLLTGRRVAYVQRIVGWVSPG